MMGAELGSVGGTFGSRNSTSRNLPDPLPVATVFPSLDPDLTARSYLPNETMLPGVYLGETLEGLRRSREWVDNFDNKRKCANTSLH